jgi:hypothetical protein
MPIQIDSNLAPQLTPLAWLVGTWVGVGIVGYPTMSETRFGQEVTFSHDGRPFLVCTSRTWLLDDEGNQVRFAATETGYWRPAGEAAEGGLAVEVLLAHPTGIVEVYVGRAYGARVDLATDVVARTATAKEYTAATRMYGLVEGDLLWVMDMAAVGHPLQSHASARLRRA